MLLFMPWCQIDKRYDFDHIRILPYRRGIPTDGLDQVQQDRVDAIIGMYKTIEDKPIHSASLLCLAGKAPIDELTEIEKDLAFELADLICFSGLARREFFASAGHYCNRDSFTVYGQEFGPPDHGVLTWRQRQGRCSSVWPMRKVGFSIPIHCYTVHEVTIDASLFESLVKYRAQANPREWDRWRDCISCFNQANTDSDNIRLQVEWVFMVGAFQRLLNANQKDKDVARRFSNTVVPKTSLQTSTSQRRARHWQASQEPLRYQWMREFYQIRNEFAHGQLSSSRSPVWTPMEHIVLGAIAFPLLVKCLLGERGLYSLSYNDRWEVDCFERLADTKDFLNPPTDPQSSHDTHWNRLHQEWIWQSAKNIP